MPRGVPNADMDFDLRGGLVRLLRLRFASHILFCCVSSGNMHVCEFFGGKYRNTGHEVKSQDNNHYSVKKDTNDLDSCWQRTVLVAVAWMLRAIPSKLANGFNWTTAPRLEVC